MKARFIDPDYRSRMDIADMLAALEDLGHFGNALGQLAARWPTSPRRAAS